MWNVPNVESTRPGIPPLRDPSHYEKSDVKLLKRYAANRLFEQRRCQFGKDGLGTVYKTSRHWELTYSELSLNTSLILFEPPVPFCRDINNGYDGGGISCWGYHSTIITIPRGP